MKFLIDAQLPRRLAAVLRDYGHEALHTLDLPQQNRTPDTDVMRYANENVCIVTTKDADFVDAFYLQGRPQQLWLLSTGNISNPDLERLIRDNLIQIATLFETYRFIELSRTAIIIHS
jgi:predicted nuclease of predicted toxin-antitoxin system